MNDSEINFDHFPDRKHSRKRSRGHDKNDSRTHPRKPFFMPVDYSTAERVYRDFIKDISMSGVFIETLRPLPVGKKISMALSFPNLNQNVKISGGVVRYDEQGIGVAFIINDEKQKDILDLCIKDV